MLHHKRHDDKNNLNMTQIFNNKDHNHQETLNPVELSKIIYCGDIKHSRLAMKNTYRYNMPRPIGLYTLEENAKPGIKGATFYKLAPA